jgi:hypothetical protein
LTQSSLGKGALDTIFNLAAVAAALLPKMDVDDKDQTPVCKIVMSKAILGLIDSFLCQNRLSFP